MQSVILKAACSLTLRGPIRSIYVCGLLARTARSWLACSPDGIAVVETELGSDIIYACVEAKTSVSEDSQADRRRPASLELVECELSDSVFLEHVDPSHIGQLVPQFLVTQFGYVLYLCVSERGLLFGCLIKENAVLTAQVSTSCTVSHAQKHRGAKLCKTSTPRAVKTAFSLIRHPKRRPLSLTHRYSTYPSWVTRNWATSCPMWLGSTCSRKTESLSSHSTSSRDAGRRLSA